MSVLGIKRPAQEVIGAEAPSKRARFGIFSNWGSFLLPLRGFMGNSTPQINGDGASRKSAWSKSAPVQQALEEDFPALDAAVQRLAIGKKQAQRAPPIASTSTAPPSQPVQRKAPLFGAQHAAHLKQREDAERERLKRQYEDQQRRQNQLKDLSHEQYRRMVTAQQLKEDWDDWAAEPRERDTSLRDISSRRRDDARIADSARAQKQHDPEMARALETARRANAAPMPPRPSLAALNEITNRNELLDKELAKRAQKRRRFPDALTPEKEARVKQILRTPDGVVASTMTGAEVTGRDIKKLAPREWLNDEVINFYTVMLNNRSKAYVAEMEGLPPADQPPLKKRKYLKVHAFTSFFVTKLKAAGYEGVRRWTKKIDLFDCDAVLMPVNQGNTHWTAACINIRKKRFEFYDSMGSRNSKLLELLRNYLKAEHQDKKKAPLDLTGWTDYQLADEAPQQENAFDCGVFTSQVIECLSRPDAALDYSQEHMPVRPEPPTDLMALYDAQYLRRKMVYEIGQKSFLEDEEWE